MKKSSSFVSKQPHPVFSRIQQTYQANKQKIGRENVEVYRQDCSSHQLRNVLKEIGSIKREMTILKKKRNEMVIDMSVCRKIADAVEECRHSKSKSFPSKKGHVLTGSSRKKKSQEKPHEKETSQELQEQREVKDFASNPQGQSKAKLGSSDTSRLPLMQVKQSHPEYGHGQSESQPVSAAKKTLKLRNNIQNFPTSLAEVENHELHQKHLLQLPSINLLQLMAPGLSADKRLKVNVEIGRLKKQLRQIPIHTNDPHLHYHNLAIYESNVANTFNSIVNLLNNLLFNVGKREKQPAPAEDHLQCKENQKFQKQIQAQQARQISQLQCRLALQLNLEAVNEESYNKLAAQFQSIEASNYELEKNNQSLRTFLESWKEKGRMARIEISQLEKALAFAREDAHHVEIERNKLRKDSQRCIKCQEKDGIIAELERQCTVLQEQTKQLKEDIVAKEVQAENQKKEDKKDNCVLERDPNSVPLEDEEKKRLLEENIEMKGTIDICLAEISTLHEVIEELRIVNERYKDKYMRNRIVDSKGTNQGRKKEQALHEIDAIIRKHKSSLTKMPVLQVP